MAARILHDVPVTAYRATYYLDRLGLVCCASCAQCRPGTVEKIESDLVSTRERAAEFLALYHVTVCEWCYVTDLVAAIEEIEARATVEYPECKIF